MSAELPQAASEDDSGRWPGTLWSRSRPYALHPRVLLAFKSGLAAAISWFVAVRLPGVAADYPYYAPLGAVVSMYPTVAASLKLGMQTLAGLAIGAGLAFVAVWLGEPDSLTIAIVVGFGVLLAGLLPRIGNGGEWIPMAGLFVLVIGGENAENYSAGYFLQMLVGVVVGLGVNILIFPPLNSNEAVLGLAWLRLALAHHFQQLNEGLRERWAADDAHWSDHEAELANASRGLRAVVEYAASSRKANPRRRLHPRDLQRDLDQLYVLEQVTIKTQDIATILREAVSGSSEEEAMPTELEEPLQEVFAAVSELLRSWTVIENDDENLAAARERLTVLRERLREHAAAQEPTGGVVYIAMSLQRIVRTLTPQLNISEDS